jgi:hypothetical protein
MHCWVCGEYIELIELPVCATCESSVKQKAYLTFVAAGGSRAHFDSWWPNLWRRSVHTQLANRLVCPLLVQASQRTH